MALSPKAQQRVLEIIREEVDTHDLVEWSELVKVIRIEVKVKNWLDVRNIIQWMKNQNEIVRTDDIHVEEYRKVM